jgi:hypothetical protein
VKSRDRHVQVVCLLRFSEAEDRLSAKEAAVVEKALYAALRQALPAQRLAALWVHRAAPQEWAIALNEQPRRARALP